MLITIIIARFYSLTNVAMLLIRSDSNSYSLLVGSACLRKVRLQLLFIEWPFLQQVNINETKNILFKIKYFYYQQHLWFSKFHQKLFFALRHQFKAPCPLTRHVFKLEGAGGGGGILQPFWSTPNEKGGFK